MSLVHDDNLLVDKKILKEHGYQVALFMAAVRDVFLQARDDYFIYCSNPEAHPRPEKVISDDGFLEITNDQLCEMTGLSDFQIMNCKKAAVSKGLLKIERRGIPARHHYRILSPQQGVTPHGNG